MSEKLSSFPYGDEQSVLDDRDYQAYLSDKESGRFDSLPADYFVLYIDGQFVESGTDVRTLFEIGRKRFPDYQGDYLIQPVDDGIIR